MLAKHFLPVMSLIMVFLPSAMGQLPKRVERCLPYPTLVQEIREMQAPEIEPRQVSVHVVRVEFNPEDGIPASVRGEISTQLRVAKSGYFRARATAKLTALGSKGADIDVAAAISVTPGTQYRTGKVRVESLDPDVPLGILAEVLRGLIPLQRGELFSAEKVRMGMENLTRAYSREGYVDMVPEPKTAIDEDTRETAEIAS